jgi:hypothetical protein
MWFPETLRTGRAPRPVRPLSFRPVLRLLPALLLVFAAAAASAESLAERLDGRWDSVATAEGVRLFPVDEESPIRSIEIGTDDEVRINGKSFESEEAIEFLGRDGELLRALLELDAEERLAELGLDELAEESAEAAEETDEAGAGEAGMDHGESRGEIDIDLPVGVPGGRVKVRVSGDDRVSVGKSIHIAADESARDVVCVGCSIDVEGSAGEAVAVGGSVRVSGAIENGVTAVGGSVDVADGAYVGGDAVAVGGSVEIEEGGRVDGQHTSVGIGGPWFRGAPRGWGFHWSAFDDFSAFVAAAMRTGMLALLGVLLVLVAGPSVDRMAARVAEEPWKAAFAGLLAQLTILPLVVLVVVVLAVSIIGIPLLLLVPFALLAFLLGWLVGFVAVARSVGGWAERRFGWNATSVALAVVVGVALIQATSLVGRLISMPGGVFAVLGFSLVGFGFFLKYVAWTVGLGAMTLVALSGGWRRRGPDAPEPAVAPPAAAPAAPPVAPPPPPPPIAPDAPAGEYPQV